MTLGKAINVLLIIAIMIVAGKIVNAYTNADHYYAGNEMYIMKGGVEK